MTLLQRGRCILVHSTRMSGGQSRQHGAILVLFLAWELKKEGVKVDNVVRKGEVV